MLALISQALGSTILLGLGLICLDFVIKFALSFVQERTVDLQGKHVLITGGSKGIGKEVAKEFARRGANISILARNVQQLSDAKAEISECVVATKVNGQKIQDFIADITADFEDIAKSVR